MSKITMAAAGAIGYVLGSRAGRERYDQITEKAQSVWNNPKVQKGKRRAQKKAEQAADDQGLTSDSDDSGDLATNDQGGEGKQFNV
ncbi:MAG: hypothetical protein WBG76_08265 [Ornithinimicrobium sp.]